MMRIALLVAMDSERRQVETLLGGTRGRVGNAEVTVSQCGIGKVNAALKAMQVIMEERPDAVVSTGVAGGVDGNIRVMDVVAGQETCYHDVWCGAGNEKGQVQGLPARYAADSCLLCAAERAGARKGLICTGDQFIEDSARLGVIKGEFPEALAVDMESAAIAQTCFLAHMPFLSLRVISDTPGNTDCHQQQYATFWRDMAEKSFRTLSDFLRNL